MSNVWWYTVCIYESGHPYLIFMTTTIKQQLYAIHDNYHQTAATKWVFGLVWVHGASKRRHQQQQIWESVSGSATPPHTHTHTPTHPPTHPHKHTHPSFLLLPHCLPDSAMLFSKWSLLAACYLSYTRTNSRALLYCKPTAQMNTTECSTSHVFSSS